MPDVIPTPSSLSIPRASPGPIISASLLYSNDMYFFKSTHMVPILHFWILFLAILGGWTNRYEFNDNFNQISNLSL